MINKRSIIQHQSGPNQQGRLYYLDILRFLVVVSLVPFHAAITYTAAGDVYVYAPGVLEYELGLVSQLPDPVHFLTGFNSVLSSFFMNLLFVIAGMSSCFALKRRSAGQFVKERLTKLVLPAVISILTWIPILSWLRNINVFGFDRSFFDFYPAFFNGIRGSFETANFEWAHLWFMVYLFVYSLLSLPLFVLLNKKGSQVPKHTGVIFGGAAFALILLSELVFRPGWPGFQNLYNDWANFTTYLLLYVFGFALVKFDGIRKELLKPWKRNLLIALGAFLVKANSDVLFFTEWGYNLGTGLQIVFGTVCMFSAVLGFLGLGEHRLNREFRFHKTVRKLSFPVYVLHYVPVTIFAFLFVTTNLNPVVQWVLISILSYISIFGLYLAVRQVPILSLSIGLQPRWWKAVLRRISQKFTGSV